MKRSTREPEARLRSLELFASGRETGWRNRLIWGDKKYVLPSLLPEFAGKVNLIYIDPPFDTGADFSFTATIPEQPDSDQDETTSFTKEPSILEQKAYRDTWGRGLDSYLQWFYEAAVLLRELLAEDGSIYIHLGPQVADYVRLIMDETFDASARQNAITWQRMYAHSDPGRYGAVSETILFYTKGEKWTWNPQYMPYSEQYLEMYSFTDEGGRRYKVENTLGPGNRGVLYDWNGHKRYWRYTRDNMQKLHDAGLLYYTRSGFPKKKIYLDEMPGKPLQDLWTDINVIAGQARELTGYPTQKPGALLERIIRSSSNEGDLVLDCFVGSGTTAAVAEKLNRRWIACDLSRFAIHTTRKRMLGIPGVKPFVVQNLGKYERQAWQAAEFDVDVVDVAAGFSPAEAALKGSVTETGATLKGGATEQRQREAAYRRFILELYHATPISGRTWLHGMKSGRMVHVGAVDAPVTSADVNAIARETWKAVASGKDAPTEAGADILGWDFAFELNETAKQVAAESHVGVAFKKIPHEVLDKKAVEQGDVKFFELGALRVSVERARHAGILRSAQNDKGREVKVTLEDFVIPSDDIPEEARKAVKHWSQLVDYWAVDWDYKNDTFHNQWQSYRTRKDPKIELEAKYTYPAPGKYSVVVKVIDILGNDTTKTVDIEVSKG